MDTVRIEIVIGIVMLLINIGTIIWGFARIMTKLEMKPSREEVQAMIDNKIDDHCPYAVDINHFKTFMENRVLLLEELKRDVLGVRINTEMICEHLKISYKR
jgi:hypothetical protein